MGERHAQAAESAEGSPGLPLERRIYVNITKKCKFLDLINTKNKVIGIFPIFIGSLTCVRNDISDSTRRIVNTLPFSSEQTTPFFRPNEVSGEISPNLWHIQSRQGFMRLFSRLGDLRNQVFFLSLEYI